MALTYDEQQGLTYLQVKGSGIANTCPVLTSGTTDLKVRGWVPSAMLQCTIGTLVSSFS